MLGRIAIKAEAKQARAASKPLRAFLGLVGITV